MPTFTSTHRARKSVVSTPLLNDLGRGNVTDAFDAAGLQPRKA